MASGTSRSAGSQGVTLLEVIVALVLLSSVGLVLFDWLRQSLDSAWRSVQWQERVEVELNAHALMKSVNPAVRPQGQMTVHGLSVSWRSTPLRPLQSILVPSMDSVEDVPSPWRIGLYRLEVSASYRPPGQARPPTEVSYSVIAVGTAGPSGAVAAP